MMKFVFPLFLLVVSFAFAQDENAELEIKKTIVGSNRPRIGYWTTNMGKKIILMYHTC